MSGNMMMLLGGAQAPAVDPLFYSVTSLLHGDGTNGGQNNTFLDSSSNNFTITRNGNTTQGAFSPFSQTGWSNYFQGSGNYLTLADATQFNLSGAAYTIECWIYPNGDYGNYNTIVAKRAPSSSSTAWEIYLRTGSGVLSFYNGTNYESAITPPAFQWNHVAAVFDGTNINLYLNGVRVLQSAITNSNISASVFIGTYPSYDERYIGYISDLRITKGAALYTGTSFTVPTAKLTTTVSAGTVSLLTCQSNRFIDNSVNAAAITITGSPSTQPFTPFNPTTPYSSGSLGGSGYFDGSLDYLTVPNNTALSLPSGTAFTIEAWIYPTRPNNGAQSGFRNIVSKRVSNTLTTNYNILLWFNSEKLGFYTGTSYLSNANIPQNAWTHFAYVYDGGTSLKLYINGVLDSTFSATPGAANSADVWIGSLLDDTGTYDNYGGYISSLRIVKGSQVYTSNFTPPTAPLTAIANTSLLTNFTNGAIFDNAAVGDYETVGNAQISTSVKKYGTGSLAFDGSGDRLFSPSNRQWNFGTGDFTVELWVYPISQGGHGSGNNDCLIDFRPGSNGAYGTLYLFNSGANVCWFVNSANRISANPIPNNQWTHIAVCRAASQTKLFINGTQSGATYADTTNYLAAPVMVGEFNDGAGAGNFQGYLDDVRISKGVARYPYNFTPPTAEFPNIGGTVTLTADPYFDYTTLLLPGNGTNGAQNNTFLDSSTNAFSITRNGNTTQGTFSPFSQTGWGNFFDGSGDYLTAPSNAAFDFGTGDFTIETWGYRTSTGAFGFLISRRAADSNYGPFSLGLDSSNVPYFLCSSSGSSWIAVLTGPALQLNSWFHLAGVRNGTTFTLYVNGTAFATATSSASLMASSVAACVGAHANGSEPFAGYISNTRIVKGTAVYTSNFTPPTVPLTAITNTSLLTCQSNRFIDNSSNAFAITRNGDVSVQAFSPFNPTAAWSAATNGGSGYFDGSGDYLSGASWASAGQFGTNDFTVEFWTYITGAPQSNQVIVSCNIYPNTTGIYIKYNGGAATDFIVASSSSAIITSSAGWSFNAWHHIAVTRSGSTMTLWINGVSRGTATFTNNLSDGLQYIGRPSDIANYMAQGYVSNLRIVKGTAVYTTTFTPPTSPVTAITNTSLLLNFTNAGITDATSKNDLETVGNAQISTTQSKFGGSSMYFDGSGDWLIGRSTDLASFGTGDFTIEGWLYPSVVTGADRVLWDTRSSSGDSGMALFIDTNGKISTYTSAAIRITSTNALTANTWQHFALCRYNGTLLVFINGLQNGTLAYSTAITCPGRISIAVRSDDAVPYTGYIDDFRVTKGIARYTANFTPPSAAFLTL